MRILLKILLYSLVFSLIFSCGKGFFKKVDTRDVPISGPERAKKNVKEGRGVGLGDMMGIGKGSTTYEFSTSNPMWRATLDILDFLPLTTVDYSGGVIISDWYSDRTSQNEAIKISVRFLSNEIQTNSLNIIVHRKMCSTATKCVVKKISSKIEEELKISIIKKAALLEKEGKHKKKKQ